MEGTEIGTAAGLRSESCARLSSMPSPTPVSLLLRVSIVASTAAASAGRASSSSWHCQGSKFSVIKQVDEQVILSHISAQFCRHGIRSYGRGMNVMSPAATWHADWPGRRESSRDQAPSLARSSFLSFVLLWLCTAARVVRQTRHCRCVGPFDSYRLPAPARAGMALFKPRVFWLPSL